MNWIEKIIKESSELLQIPSVRSEGVDGAPYGVEVDRALKYLGNLCEKAGLDLYLDERGYYGYADTKGPLEYMVLGHVDVVASGDRSNWDDSPFSGKIVSDRIYGRGAQDMKVPMVVMVNVLEKMIADKVEFKKGIRFIIGTDEECEFGGLKAYERENEFMPYGFTPDGCFGVINVESSLIEYQVDGDEEIDFEISGGTGYNTVPDICRYKGRDIDKIYTYLYGKGYNVKFDRDELIVLGRGVHVLEIENGINAIQILVEGLYMCGIRSKVTDYLYESFGLTTDSAPINGRVEDSYSGKLSSNIGEIYCTSKKQEVKIDLRIPILTDEKLLIKLHYDQVKRYGLSYKEYFNDRKVFVSEKDPFVQTLIGEYEKVSGVEGSFISSRGGSYSKVADNIVGFGMNFPDLGQVDLAHQANEHYEFKYIKLAFEIYYNTLCKLVSEQ